MIDELEKSLPAFSSVNCTRCFAHILNLIAKSILKLFDVEQKKKKKKGEGGDDDGATAAADDDDDSDLNDDLSNKERELLELAGDIDDEELTMRHEYQGDDDKVEDDDDEDGWVDEVAELTEKEREELKETIRPVSRVLIKVCTETYRECPLTLCTSFEKYHSS